jgi:hypothetical protein
MATNYQLTPAAFGWLSQAFSDQNAISPLTLFASKAADFSEQDKQSLLDQAMVGPDGTIDPAALAALQILAKADAYARIKILGTTAPVDKLIYFQGDTSCSLDSSADRLTLTCPALAQEAAFVMEEFSGTSRLVNVPFQASLSPHAALALLSLVDLHRKQGLMALAGESRPASFAIPAILAQAAGSDSWLNFGRCLKALATDVTLAEAELPAALAELKARQIITETAGQYALTGEALELARTLLIPAYVFNISTGKMTSPTTCIQSECFVVFCGMHDLLYIDTDQDQIVIETLSGSDLFRILVGALNESPAKTR